MIHTPRVLAAALWQNLFYGKREHGRCVKMLGAHECANTHTDMGQGTKDIPSRHACTHKQLLTVAQCMYCATPQHLHNS